MCPSPDHFHLSSSGDVNPHGFFPPLSSGEPCFSFQGEAIEPFITLLAGRCFFMRAQPNRKHRVPRKHKLGTGPALSAPAACPAEQGGQAGHGSHLNPVAPPQHERSQKAEQDSRKIFQPWAAWNRSKPLRNS